MYFESIETNWNARKKTQRILWKEQLNQWSAVCFIWMLTFTVALPLSVSSSCMCVFRLVHKNRSERNGTESNREICIHFIQMHTQIWLCTRTGHYPYSVVLFFLMLVDFVVVYFHYLVQVGAFEPFKSWILYKHNLAIHLNVGFCLAILFGQSPAYDSSFGGAFVFAFAAKQ